MAIGLETVQSWITSHTDLKANVIVNKDQNGLTTTKARGGVFGLAGLLNIGKRAQYGRETLDALKGALVSEFKSQNNLSEQESSAKVDKVFREVFNMDFATARKKALKVNLGNLKKIRDVAHTEVASGSVVQTNKLDAEAFIDHTIYSPTHVMADSNDKFKSVLALQNHRGDFQLEVKTLSKFVGKARLMINYNPCSRAEANEVSQRLGRFVGEIRDNINRMTTGIDLLAKSLAEEKRPLSDQEPIGDVTDLAQATQIRLAENKQTLLNMLDDLEKKVNARVTELNNMFV